MTSQRALSLGAALFLVMAALAAKTLEINDISGGNRGILGGPVAIAALQTGPNRLSVDASLGTEDPAVFVSADRSPAPASDLSTGALDGTQPFQAISASEPENNPSLLEKNQKAIKAVAALASEPAAASKKASTRYFVQPTSGKNWGALHGHNAVDIANSCGTPVVAAAAGTVVSDPGLGSGVGGWNSGYGSFVLIKHANGTKTRYAHLSKINVSIGEEVQQGEQIGKIGNTGHVEGRTGCHLHFEVLGGSNPFAHR